MADFAIKIGIEDGLPRNYRSTPGGTVIWIVTFAWRTEMNASRLR